LTWTSWVSLRLERADLAQRRREDYHSRLHLALSGLDRHVQGTLERESNRPTTDYAPWYNPGRVWDADGMRLDPREVIEVSPIVEAELEPWLLLHFQVSPSQSWTSPEASYDELVRLEGFHPPARQSSQAAAEMLAALRRALTPDDLGEMLTAARDRDRANNPFLTPDRTQDAVVGQGRTSDSRSAAEYARRRRITDLALETSQAGEECDPVDLAVLHLLRQPDEAGAAGTLTEGPEQVALTPSPMTGIWLHLGERGVRFLAFVRTVPFRGEDIYQGFLLDWASLQAQLVAEIRELLPEAELIPVESGPQDRVETLMTTLPVRLAPPPPPDGPVDTGWTATHSGLTLAWVAAVTLLAAIGLGVRSLLAMAERRSQFAYAVSHELRTPLTTFRLYTDMLASGMVPPESRDEYLATLNTESERLSQLVVGVLEYSRLEHHAVQLAPSETTVGQLLESARERFEPRCAQSDRRLVIEANGLADRTWRTDPDLALQIIGTLIDNACKYAAGAEDPRVILSAGLEGPGRLVLTVRDFGPGISRRERRRIFQPFQRGCEWSTTSAGIGLGLALARRWAQLLGGKLELRTDRDPSPGACFCLTIAQLPEHTL
ncbi:MAG: HAMP domain-containing histidine kinase, partial [Planctomycetes bacterium]|nr:HAMP domain-containing histidine kinase [Planctomycetota bacterium]